MVSVQGWPVCWRLYWTSCCDNLCKSKVIALENSGICLSYFVATHWCSVLLTYIPMTCCGPAAVNWDSTLWHSSSWWPDVVLLLWIEIQHCDTVHPDEWPAVVLLLWIEIQHSDTVPLYLLHLITKLITLQHKAYTWWWTSHHRRPSSCRRVYVCDAVLLVVWRVFILRLLGCDCE